MECGGLVYHKVTIMTENSDSMDYKQKKTEKETIHSGHFMVSHFEAEAQDDEYDVAIPLAIEDSKFSVVSSSDETTQTFVSLNEDENITQQVSIETSLTKLFQCMSLAYRQKLTSPKWNRFKGIRLRWKDKIRLNNVIWRCWHMQFIMKQNTMVCQFASPLDVDTHNKPEAVVLEGKYWKRKLAAVTAEYKKWRMFYRNRIFGCAAKDSPEMLSAEVDMFDWQPHSNDSNSVGSMMMDEDYMEFMSDTLFSTIQSNQPFAFPDSREIARGAGLADFIQPSLVQLQPNLDDFMDTLEPLQDLVSLSQNIKLPSVPEEYVADDIYRSNSRANAVSSTFPDISLLDNQSSALPVQILPQQKQRLQQPQQPKQHEQQRQQRQHQHQQTQHNLQFTNSLFPPPGVSSYSSGNHMSSTESFAQGTSVNITYNDTAATPVNTTTPRTSRVPSTFQRGSRLDQRNSSTRFLQSEIMTPTPAGTTTGLFQHQQETRETVLLPQPQQTQCSPFQNVSSTNLPQTAAQEPQQSQFMGQQNTLCTVPQQQSSQIQGFKICVPSPSSFSETAQQPVVNRSPPAKPNAIRSNSLTNPGEDLFAVPKYNSRPRSVTSLSSSSTTKRQRPPLLSTNSDPSLTTGHSPNFQPLLTQLLSANNTNNVFSFTASDRFKSQVVPIRPMPSQTAGNSVCNGNSQTSLPHTTTALLITTPVTVATVPSLPSSAVTSSSNCNQLLINSINSLNNNQKVSHYCPDSSTSLGLNLCSLPSSITLSAMTQPKSLYTLPDSASHSRRQDPHQPKEHRRECHTKAEHKRRCNIKNGFDMLHSLIPHLHQNPNAKLSKAAMLQKGADYIQQLRTERDQLREEAQCLKQEIESLNASISNCQSLLPATGAPVSRQRATKMKEMFEEYVRVRTLENWKFWIFSILIEPLLTSFNSSVSTASLDDLYRSALHWVEQHCSLVDLRPAVLNSLRYLSTATEILTDPSKLPEEARRAVLKQDQQQ